MTSFNTSILPKPTSDIADSLALALVALLRTTEPPKHPMEPTRLDKLIVQRAREQAYGVLADYEAMP